MDFTNGISRVVWPDFNIPGQEASRKGEPKTAGLQKLRVGKVMGNKNKQKIAEKTAGCVQGLVTSKGCWFSLEVGPQAVINRVIAFI